MRNIASHKSLVTWACCRKAFSHPGKCLCESIFLPNPGEAISIVRLKRRDFIIYEKIASLWQSKEEAFAMTWLDCKFHFIGFGQHAHLSLVKKNNKKS